MTPEEKQSLQELQIVFSKTGALALADLIENQDRYKAALSSAINPWQPMETAPAYAGPGFDPILVADEHGNAELAWRRSEDRWASAADSDYDVVPVCWMPLPELPADIAATKKKNEAEAAARQEENRKINEQREAERQARSIVVAKPYDGCLVRASNGYRIYKVEHSRKRWIIDAGVFNRLGYDWNAVKIITPQEEHEIITGEEIK